MREEGYLKRRISIPLIFLINSHLTDLQEAYAHLMDHQDERSLTISLDDHD